MYSHEYFGSRIHQQAPEKKEVKRKETSPFIFSKLGLNIEIKQKKREHGQFIITDPSRIG